MKRLSLYERARLAAERAAADMLRRAEQHRAALGMTEDPLRVPHMPHKWSSERIHWRLGWMAGWRAAKREMKKRRR